MGAATGLLEINPTSVRYGTQGVAYVPLVSTRRAVRRLHERASWVHLPPGSPSLPPDLARSSAASSQGRPFSTWGCFSLGPE